MRPAQAGDCRCHLAGYSKLYAYPAGIQGWPLAGLPLATTDVAPPEAGKSARAVSPNGVIGTNKLLEIIEGRHGDHLLVDVRDTDAYRQGHIPGAVSLPLAKIKQQGPVPVSGAEAERLIVFYCWYEECGLSTEAVQQARQAGYRNAVASVAGVRGWTGAGLRLDGSETAEPTQPPRPVPPVRGGSGKRHFEI